jgi:integrase
MSAKRKRDKDGIFDRGDGWLYLQHDDRRISLKTKDRAAARKAAAEYKQRKADPAHTAAGLKTVAGACQIFRNYAKTGENRDKPPSEATFSMYEAHMGHFVRIFGADTTLDAIDSGAVDEYIATRRAEHVGKRPEKGPDTRRNVTANTVDKELGTLRQILRLGLRRGWFHLPLERVLPASSGARYVPLTRFLTVPQVRLLLDVLAPGRAATLAYVFAFGADWCAVERAERDDLGGASSCNLLVLIRGTKNAKRWDEVPLVAPFHEFAERARAYLATHGAFPVWGKQRMRDMATACRRAGVPRVTPRDLRRSHGKALAAAGVSPHLIGRMLRHTDSRMAERTYAVPERMDIARQVAAVTRAG